MAHVWSQTSLWHFVLASHLVDKLLHPRLQPPHLELDHHQLVGAHDGLGVLPPALLQRATAGLGGAEVPEVLAPGGRGDPSIREVHTASLGVSTQRSVPSCSMELNPRERLQLVKLSMDKFCGYSTDLSMCKGRPVPQRPSGWDWKPPLVQVSDSQVHPGRTILTHSQRPLHPPPGSRAGHPPTQVLLGPALPIVPRRCSLVQGRPGPHRSSTLPWLNSLWLGWSDCGRLP